MIKAPRGTRDLLPPDTALWNFVAAVRDVFRVYNLPRNPHSDFESTDLFARGVGEETDIVAKEMLTWEDRGRAESDKGQSLTLRPENTAGVVRAYIEHKLWDRGLNKLFYIGPASLSRASGRRDATASSIRSVRKFWVPQSSGSESPARDAEILELLATLLDRLGIKGWTLELNSVGCPSDRAKFNEALRKGLEPIVGKMCPRPPAPP
jgi:histidyl-tRNA synthetase